MIRHLPPQRQIIHNYGNFCGNCRLFQKVKHFLWRVFQNALATGDNLECRGCGTHFCHLQGVNRDNFPFISWLPILFVGMVSAFPGMLEINPSCSICARFVR